MRIKVSKFSLPDLITLLIALLQGSLILINCVEPQDTINHTMYIINYVFGFAAILSLCVNGIAKHLLAISFLGCFMLFLMAQKPFEPDYNVYLTFARVQLNTKQYFTFSVILFIGLCVTYYSYLFFTNNGHRQKAPEYNSTIDYQNIKPLLTVMLVVTLPCAFYMQGRVVFVRASMAYTSGYLVNVEVPALIKIGYYLYSTVVLLYLALKPTKAQAFFVLATYLIIEGGLQVFQGRRALFASTLLFIVWYLVKYYNIKKLDFKLIFGIGAVFVGLLILLIVVERARDNATGSFSLNVIRRFLISTGGSDSVIANTIYRADLFPKSGLTYLIDPLLNNPIVNVLLSKPSVPQGLAYLQYHNSFSHWLSYMTESSLYLSGHGMGSCYLAEVWLAFGMIGVFIVSVLVGWVVCRLSDFHFGANIFKNAFVFFMIRRLFTFPRDGMLSWAGSGLLYMIFTFMIVYPFYECYCMRTSYPERCVNEQP